MQGNDAALLTGLVTFKSVIRLDKKLQDRITFVTYLIEVYSNIET